MNVQITDYVDVRKRALELGCNEPRELCILPRNFDTAKSRDELIHESSTPTVRVLWKQAGIQETKTEKEGEKFPQISEKQFIGWIGPTIFVGASLLSQNPNVISIALGVISNYLTDWFKGTVGDKRVRLDIVVEMEGNKYKRVHYEGNVDGLKELPKILHEVRPDE